jgi:hypothetical protein
MINVKKGTAHTLAQSDRVAPVVASEGVIAGMLVAIDPAATPVNGVKKAGVVTTGTDNRLLAFALSNQTDGDVIESGKIGVYHLDGNSVIETDQYNGSPVAADIGKHVTADIVAGSGKVNLTAYPAASTLRVVGRLEGIRTLPFVTIPAVAGTTPNFETKTLIAIKLAANA